MDGAIVCGIEIIYLCTKMEDVIAVNGPHLTLLGVVRQRLGRQTFRSLQTVHANSRGTCPGSLLEFGLGSTGSHYKSARSDNGIHTSND